MSFEELYPVVKTQAYFSVFRYDSRRQDKIQELVSQSYEKYLSDKEKSKEITTLNFKNFVKKRSNELDVRSIVKKGNGGTSVSDPIGFYQRRSNSETKIVQYDDFLLFQGKANEVERNYNFQIDFKEFFKKLSELQQRVFSLKSEGFVLKEIARKLKISVSRVFNTLNDIKMKFKRYFELEPALA